MYSQQDRLSIHVTQPAIAQTAQSAHSWPSNNADFGALDLEACM